MMIIIFIELCRIADSLLWIPKSSRRTSSISTYLILLPYKKWNPNNRNLYLGRSEELILVSSVGRAFGF
ncbi:SX2_G0033000.mRNA.1.CDS.1 [Saccharomyces cerevisiae]|nr:SX2_G0033000.mRNA.1.CDS.1 [Saccharomyces cerevisiae]